MSGGTMKFRPLLLLPILASLLTTLPGEAAPKKPKPEVLLKVATLAPEGSTWMNLMHELDKRVREETGNEVGLKFYAGGVQGDERLVLRKMRSGQLHGGGFTGNGLGVVAPSLRVLESPFLFESEDEIDAVYAELGSEFDAAIEASGHVLLGWAEVGFVHLFTKKPVRSVNDLRSAKMWLWEGDPLALAFFEEAGVAPVSLAITDVYTSLQTGLVDGVYSSPYAGVVLQWHTQVAAMSEIPITHAIGAVIVTRKQWDKISEPSQAAIRGVAADVFPRLKASSREDNRGALKAIREAGIEVVPFPAAEMQQFREIGKRAALRGVGDLYPAELLERVRSVIAADRTTAGNEAAATDEP
ncbi:MAG: C4-dicarboxylate ABC transporter [Gemmatimonadota bacterium]|nr:MAG: C4-dicarboxylate ABC transporter [Gemmatimonadota bacterium]